MDRTEAAREIIANSGSGLCLDLRFMTRTVLSLGHSFDGKGIPWFDGKTAHFDPDWVIDSYRKDPNIVTRSIAHMAIHCILGHRVPETDPMTVLSEDMVAEYVLDSLDTPHVTVPGRDDRMYACEKYFKRAGTPSPDLIRRELDSLSQWQRDDYVRMFLVDDHSKRTDIDTGEWDEISKQVMTEVEGFSRNLEGRTEGFMSILRIRNRRRYDHRAFLRRFMTTRHRVKENLDEFDYIYYSYGLSVYGNMPLIDSLEYSEDPSVDELVIAIDTSGSTMRGQVMRFLEEAFDILRTANPGKGSELHIIQCDDMVRRDDVVRNEQDIRILMDGFVLEGGGRTDFRPVFDYVDSLREQGNLKGLKGLMFFTDGLGTYPVRRPDYDTAFIFCEEVPKEHPVPPWAMRISVRPSDIG